MSPASDAGLPSGIAFGREICGDLAAAERREWWLANARGAYAAGTVAGTLTRRYHGLLVAPLVAPLGRYLVCAKADATLVDGVREWPLHANRWAGGTVAPDGHVHVERFHLEGTRPVWRHAAGDLRVESRVWMAHGADVTYVAWRLDPASARRNARLVVRVLANCRDHHGSGGPWAYDPAIEPLDDGGGLRVTHRGEPAHALWIRARGGPIAPARDWVERFDLPAERERGLSDVEHHLCVGVAELEIRPGEWVGLAVGTVDPALDRSPVDLEAALATARERERSLLARAREAVPELRDAPAWIDQLVLAADSFVFARPLPGVPDGESVIAGYPWFGDWGRDTMIALPGLTLFTGRADSALRILRTFARFADRGMLPNVFPGAGESPDYNTVDAALWYVEAWRAWLAETGDRAAAVEALPVLGEVIAHHRDGTRHGIRLDPADGLLRAGEPGVQLTWMDAKVGDHVVTPRIGKPVEINALWFNALEAMAWIVTLAGADPAPYRALAEAARAGFRRFVRPGGGLYDVIDGPGGDDATVRPNQVLAVSLPASPLDAATQSRVVDECARELLASQGLRSLSPNDPAFRPRYAGGVWERDTGYHQGPVWTWLLGHFALAEARVTGDPAGALARLDPIAEHLADAGLGTVSEIFDGAAPHVPRGAPAQAWSVACTLESWCRLERARRAAAGRIDDSTNLRITR